MTSAVTFAADDPSLTERLCRSDESALAAVYDRYANLVFAAALRIVIDRQAAEDVTQEVFVHLWRNAAVVDQARGGLRPFLVTLARRRAVDHVRQEESRRRRQVRAASGWQGWVARQSCRTSPTRSSPGKRAPEAASRCASHSGSFRRLSSPPLSSPTSGDTLSARSPSPPFTGRHCQVSGSSGASTSRAARGAPVTDGRLTDCVSRQRGRWFFASP